MSSQHGLLLRRQALGTGMSPEEVRRRVRAGEWVAVRRGVYTTAALWECLDVYVGRPLLVVRAASLNSVMPHVISHDSAALLHGLPLVWSPPALVHVTRFGVLGHRTRHGVKHHQAPFRPEQVVLIDGLPVLDRARTAADLGREHGLKQGVAACDAALRLGDSRRDLAAAVEAMRSWPYVTPARAAVELADDGAESIGESLSRVLLTETGVGQVETQFGLRDRGVEAWCDLRVGRHVIEFDGRVKYRRVEDGGVAQRPVEDVVWLEKQRQDFICGFKLGMSRLVWADLQPDQWSRTQQRLLREIRDTDARFGTSIADLAPYVIRSPRRRSA
ncbi:type IV toxin-antitoxin system AbiEi family antitoxin domain-containing protein [Nocardioides sp. KIGAM211]|uniref:Type IV toxin-antitoxin system AbiEi family antitoxin domain-containing protein n=1 Tax=Nocardioides luti TaxID=2761101 RepID=A0A7X0VBM7_9ACTN|nr:type IV toxin-antitoxin system AbiEi family antitoxin domain-containing protein [Nocardioides luti]MBB6627343.1 type IV toxin-antitoxin system AbiEi family antitoxin domain-containing protein [Nocardioides luti]